LTIKKFVIFVKIYEKFYVRVPSSLLEFTAGVHCWSSSQNIHQVNKMNPSGEIFKAN